MNPVLARLALLLVLPFVVLAVAAYTYFQHGLPRAGDSVLQGQGGAITLAMDAHGVTQIRAMSDRDVFYAMGYLHARDRTWALELGRRIAQGRVSELLGQSALQQDIWMRTLGLYRAAQASEQYLSPEARASLQAYSEGVNLGFDQAARYCPEMVAFGVQPERWRPADSLAMLKLVALSMTGSLHAKIERNAALRLLNKAQATSLFGQAAPTSALRAGVADQYLDMAFRLAQAQPPSMAQARAVGSNAWAIAGKHSADGKAILANDPHMSLAMPSAWYAARQSGDRLRADGMTLVGLPLVIFGKNGHIAWGGTNLMADTADLYVELPTPGAPERYAEGDGTQAFRLRTEEINVARKSPAFLYDAVPPVVVQIRETDRGPIISDALAEIDQPVSLRWTGLDADDTSYDAFLRMNRAGNWNEFRAAAAIHVAPALNLVYASADGDIGLVVAGRIPLRATGDGSNPQPGWDGAHRWQGYVPAERLPAMRNPARGFVVSANNRIVDLQYPDFITNDWAEPYRAQRIEQMLGDRLASGQAMTVEAAAAMQFDVVSRDVEDLLPVLLATQPTSDLGRQALALLRHWDGRMSADSAAAAVYEAWLQRLRERLVAPVAERFRDPRRSATAKSILVSGMRTQVLVREARSAAPAWCASQGCAIELTQSLNAALRDISKLAGNDATQWRWGSLHAVHLAHLPFSQIPLLRQLFERRYASPGGGNTVDVANARLNASEGYEQTFGAAFRQVMQPGPGRHLYLNSTGQSGNPLSGHYDDMIDVVQTGKLLEFSTAAPAVGSLHR